MNLTGTVILFALSAHLTSTSRPPSVASERPVTVSDATPILLSENDDVGEEGFSPSLFKFKTTLPDDGQDKGGGWQEATATLRFVDARHFIPKTWTCPVKIGMPLRSEKHGKIDPTEAGKIASRVTTAASVTVMRRQTEWPVTDLYCIEWYKEMKEVFRKKYEGLGGRAERG